MFFKLLAINFLIKAIMEAYKSEFEKRLSNRNPEEGWEEYTEETNIVVREWLKGGSESSPPLLG